MIFAKLDTPSTYTPLLGNSVWEKAITALEHLSASSPLGTTELLGQDMYLNVHSYETRPEAECRFEGHRDMIDLQYVIRGGEQIDWALKSTLEEDGLYDAEKDFQYYLCPQKVGVTDSGWTSQDSANSLPVATFSRIHLTSGHFAIFFTDDGHRPQINDGLHKGVLKAVVKIHRNLMNTNAEASAWLR